MNYIKFEKAEYTIDKIDISAKPGSSDRLVIYLKLDAHTDADLGEFVPTELSLYTETGLKTGLKTLAKIDGKQFSYKTPNAGGIYVSEHDDIKSSVFTIAEKEGRLFFTWTGKIDVPEDLFPADTIGTEFKAEFDVEKPEPEKIYYLNLFESKVSVIDNETVLEVLDASQFESESIRIRKELDRLSKDPKTDNAEHFRWTQETFIAEIPLCITKNGEEYNGSVICIGNHYIKSNRLIEFDPECPVEIDIVELSYYPAISEFRFKFKVR